MQIVSVHDGRQPLFCYGLTIAGREFAIQVTHQDMIHWDDYQERRRSRSTGMQHPVGSVLMTEPDEFTVSFALGDELSERIRRAAASFEADKWTTEDEQRLDEHLIPLFWKRVNLQLAHPLREPTDETR